MKETGAVPAMLRRENRVRYLKLIAVFKILKGLFLLSLGISLIFLNSRTRWMDAISDWADDELLVVHSKTLHYLLNQLQIALAAGHLRATGLIALFLFGDCVYRRHRSLSAKALGRISDDLCDGCVDSI